ncbi:MAG: hypothetical protein SGCHY_000396 [Lobulomycetales sp.]
MNNWGTGLLNGIPRPSSFHACAAVSTLGEMLAIGFDLPKDTFTTMLKDGPHLLAPTASDLDKYGKVGTVLAGFHYDLNFITIHGKSRYPGLHIWSSEGEKLAAKIPNGCLLIQAGKQMEWLTGGHVKAGYHEVVVTEGTLLAAERQREKGRPNWRISSTLFSHVASDVMLAPIPGRFASIPGAKEMYPAMLTGSHVEQELKEIQLFMKEQ